MKCISHNSSYFYFYFYFLCVQSNKREKETPPLDTQNNKELEQPVAKEPLEKPKLASSQPQPPSPPAYGQARRGGGKTERGVKRGPKNKTTNTTGADSVAGRGAADSTVRSSLRAEQQQLEPGAKRSGVRTTKTTSPADRESTAANENAPTPPYKQPHSSRSPQVPSRAEDNRSEKRRDEQEEKHGAAAVAPAAAALAAASHNNKTQVSSRHGVSDPGGRTHKI